MFHQTFALGDLPVVLLLVVLEGLLSADNALVLAIMVRHLPVHQQRRALLYGLGGAFIFRLIAILLATQVIKLWFLQALGAFYLLYLPIKHFRHQADKGKVIKPVGRSFWGTVIAVEIADIAFAIDSVLAGVALVKSADKVWVIYLGAVVGIILLRVAAGALLGFLAKYPFFDHVAYLIVGWVGVKLAFMAGHNGSVVLGMSTQISQMNGYLFWSVLAVIATVGTLVALRHPAAAGHGAPEHGGQDADEAEPTATEAEEAKQPVGGEAQ